MTRCGRKGHRQKDRVLKQQADRGAVTLQTRGNKRRSLLAVENEQQDNFPADNTATARLARVVTVK